MRQVNVLDFFFMSRTSRQCTSATVGIWTSARTGLSTDPFLHQIYDSASPSAFFQATHTIQKYASLLLVLCKIFLVPTAWGWHMHTPKMRKAEWSTVPLMKLVVGMFWNCWKLWPRLDVRNAGFVLFYASKVWRGNRLFVLYTTHDALAATALVVGVEAALASCHCFMGHSVQYGQPVYKSGMLILKNGSYPDCVMPRTRSIGLFFVLVVGLALFPAHHGLMNSMYACCVLCHSGHWFWWFHLTVAQVDYCSRKYLF